LGLHDLQFLQRVTKRVSGGLGLQGFQLAKLPQGVTTQSQKAQNEDQRDPEPSVCSQQQKNISVLLGVRILALLKKNCVLGPVLSADGSIPF